MRSSTIFADGSLFLSWLGFVEKEIKKVGIPMVDTGENPEVPFPRDMIDLEVISSRTVLVVRHIGEGLLQPNPNRLCAPQATFEKLENELKEINTNQEALKKNFLELTELKHILHRTQQFFDEVRQRLRPRFGKSQEASSQLII